MEEVKKIIDDNDGKIKEKLKELGLLGGVIQYEVTNREAEIAGLKTAIEVKIAGIESKLSEHK